MMVSALLLNLLADCTMKMVILRLHIIHETHRELTGNAKDTATVHLVRTATNKKAKHERFGKLESKVPNDDSNHNSTRSVYKKPFPPSTETFLIFSRFQYENVPNVCACALMKPHAHLNHDKS